MYRVSKILNNNGVIAINTEDNQEYVLLGKGIGFGKKVSQRFEVTEDTATYRLTEQTDRGSAKSLVQEMDPEFLEIADEVIREAEKVFGKVDRRIMIPLADHISFAVCSEIFCRRECRSRSMSMKSDTWHFTFIQQSRMKKCLWQCRRPVQ